MANGLGKWEESALFLREKSRQTESKEVRSKYITEAMFEKIKTKNEKEISSNCILGQGLCEDGFTGRRDQERH